MKINSLPVANQNEIKKYRSQLEIVHNEIFTYLESEGNNSFTNVLKDCHNFILNNYSGNLTEAAAIYTGIICKLPSFTGSHSPQKILINLSTKPTEKVHKSTLPKTIVNDVLQELMITLKGNIQAEKYLYYKEFSLNTNKKNALIKTVQSLKIFAKKHDLYTHTIKGNIHMALLKLQGEVLD